MGSPDKRARAPQADESPQHEVEIEPLWMGKYELTWDEYDIFMSMLDIDQRKSNRQTATENDKWLMPWPDRRGPIRT